MHLRILRIRHLIWEMNHISDLNEVLLSDEIQSHSLGSQVSTKFVGDLQTYK